MSEPTQQPNGQNSPLLIVLISGVFHSAYDELRPSFEDDSGIKVDSFVSGELFRKLGIEAQMSGKAHEVQGTTPVAKTIADGTYEVGFQSLSELGAVDGVKLVGALPDPVGLLTPVAGAVAARSRSPHAAAALLRFLSRSEHAAICKKHGLDLPAKETAPK